MAKRTHSCIHSDDDGTDTRPQIHPRKRSRTSKSTPIAIDSDSAEDEPTKKKLTQEGQRTTAATTSSSAPSIAETEEPEDALEPIEAPATARSTEAKDLWAFFKKGDKDKGRPSYCMRCRELIKRDGADKHLKLKWQYSAGTSNPNLRDHIRHLHPVEYVAICKQNGWQIKIKQLQPVEQGQTTLDGIAQPGVVNRLEFSKSAFADALVRFIAANDQSIYLVECPEFRTLILLLREELNDSDIPHRTSTRDYIIKYWELMFKKLQLELKNSVGQISYCTDIWSDPNLRAYIALTAHFISRISGRLELQTRLIAFHPLTGKHDGDNIAQRVFAMIQQAGVLPKMFKFTLDNAANNGTFLARFQQLLEAEGIPFDCKEDRIQCFPHVINIAVQHVLSALTDKKYFTDTESTFEPSAPSAPSTHPGGQTFEEVLKRDPVALGQALVQHMRASTQRREHLAQIIENGNRDGEFSTPVPALQLLQDVDTRHPIPFEIPGDPTKRGIARYRVLQPAIDIFIRHPKQSSIAKYQLNTAEWKALRDVEVLLSVPHRFQQVMSKEKTPVLAGTIPAFEMLMISWQDLAKKQPQLAPFIEVGMDKLVEYYNKMDRTKAYVIAMAINPTVKLSWIKKNWDQMYIDQAETWIREELEKYRAKNLPIKPPIAATNAPTRNSAAQANHRNSLTEEYDLVGSDDEDDEVGVREQSVEDEMRAYLTSPHQEKETDLLAYWEVNSHLHPTWFRVAMDYLPIQASAVPCERVFSSSKETTTDQRNRMKPELVEALQMLKFSLKQERLNFTMGWGSDENDYGIEEVLVDNTFLDGIMAGGVEKALALNIFARNDV